MQQMLYVCVRVQLLCKLKFSAQLFVNIARNVEHNQPKPNPPKFSFYPQNEASARSKMHEFLCVVRGWPHSTCGACMYLLHCVIAATAAASVAQQTIEPCMANKNVLMQLTSLHNNLIARRRSSRRDNPSHTADLKFIIHIRDLIRDTRSHHAANTKTD